MDIEEIKRLNEARTDNEWYCVLDGNLVELISGPCLEDKNDALFIAAAIAQKCIDLDKENKHLARLLRELISQVALTDGAIKRLEEAIKKAGVL